MSNSTIADVWRARPPREWPGRPHRMSVSRLLDIEACPRRWALSAAEYPEVWSGHGYPERPNPRAMAGSVVHRAMEVITDALAAAGCPSVKDPLFFSVLKGLGGYTKIINGCVSEVLSAYDGNPRAEHTRRALETKLRGQVNGFRERVQAFTGRLQLQPTEVVEARGPVEGTKSYQEERGRPHPALVNGSHPEVKLALRDRAWVGYADLINVSDDGCEIVDFKTGAPKPEHAFQLRTYNLMWLRDERVNPEGKAVNTLTLAYPEQEVSVPPLAPSEVDAFEADLFGRERTALALLEVDPPPVRPSKQNCDFCPVRQLCEEYWTPATQRQLAAERKAEALAKAQRYLDIEVDMRGRQGTSSYKADVRVGGELSPGSRIIVRASKLDAPAQSVLGAGGGVRLVDAYVEDSGDEPRSPPVVVVVGAGGEAFLVE